MSIFFIILLFLTSWIKGSFANDRRLGCRKTVEQNDTEESPIAKESGVMSGMDDQPCQEWYDQAGSYMALSAEDKEACVMKMVLATKGQRAKYLNDTEFFSLAPTIGTDLSFGPGDKLPYDVKVFHTVGFIASVEYVSTVNHQYTGLFKGAPYAVIRLGPVHGYDEIEQTDGMDYAAAIKFFRNGMNSSDLLASLDNTQTSGNFFEQKLSNWINEDNQITTESPDSDYWRTLVIGIQFENLAKEQSKVRMPEISTAILNVTELSKFTFQGKAVPDNELQSPFLVTLMPNEVLKKKFSCVELGLDLFESTFSKIPTGTVLYDVYTKSDLESKPEKIGYIRTKTIFYETLFGDTELRFSHVFHDALIDDDDDDDDDDDFTGCPYRRKK